MADEPKSVKEYLHDLQSSKGDKPQQVRDALEIYVDLWKRVIEKGIVSPADSIDEALAKIESSGGLYAAAE